MKIVGITTEIITIPLIKTFKTALRTIDTVENVVVTIKTDTGEKGYGSAAPTPVITGDTLASIQGAIEYISPFLTGLEIINYELLFQKLNSCILGNMSAKAAIDMAVYDLLGKAHKTPLYKFLGGAVNTIETDITISLNPVHEMMEESRQKTREGFNILKIKVGDEPDLDIARLEAIKDAVEDAVEDDVQIRIDANQGWSPKEAVFVGQEIEKRNIPVVLMEQPVLARDFAGLKYVRDNIALPVFADESVFSPQDALQLINMGAVDGLNIKLMKCGGIYNALKIAAIAESANIPCMIGSMMECSISVTAAAHLAASRSIIKGYDLDAPLFCSSNPAEGGMIYNGSTVSLSDLPGLGIKSITP